MFLLAGGGLEGAAISIPAEQLIRRLGTAWAVRMTGLRYGARTSPEVVREGADFIHTCARVGKRVGACKRGGWRQMCACEVYVRLDPVVCASRECSSVWSSRSVFCPFLFFFFLLSFGQNTSRYSAAMRYGGRTTRRALSALLSPPFLTCALSMPWCAYVCLRRVLFLSFSILLSMLQSNAQRCDPRY